MSLGGEYATEMMMEELLHRNATAADILMPCPFCGGEAHIAHQSPLTEGVIICDGCKAMVCFPWYKAETGLELKKAWNRRAYNG